MNLLYGIIIGIIAEKIIFPIIDEFKSLLEVYLEEKRNKIFYRITQLNQQLEDDEVNGSKSLTKDYDLKILVSLSCTMCPDLVVAAQHLAAINPHVKAHVYDLNLYPDLKDKYKVMSVPCTVTNDDNVSFGRKSFTELVEHLQKI